MSIRERVFPALKKLGILLIALGVTAGILYFFYQYSERSRASIEYPVGVFFSPEKIESEPNKEVFVDIQASTPQPISIATVLIRFPKKILTFEKEKTLAYSTAPCGHFEKGIDARVVAGDENFDTIILTRGTEKNNGDLPKNVFCFGRIIFSTKADGTGTISFAQQPSGNWNFDIAGPSGKYSADFGSGIQQVAVKVTGAVNPDPTTTTQPTATSAPKSGVTRTPRSSNKDVNATILVRFQGITTQPKMTAPITAQIKLEAVGDDTREYETVSFLPQSDGKYKAEHIFKNVNLSSKYMMQIKGSKHLQRNICVNAPSESVGGFYHCNTSEISFAEGSNTFDFTTISLLAGDIPVQNRLIDSADIIYVRNNVGSTSSDVLSRGDLNNDGIVDTQDFALVIYSLGFKYDED